MASMTQCVLELQRLQADFATSLDALSNTYKGIQDLWLYWGYIGIMEKKMETTIVYWDYIGLYNIWVLNIVGILVQG